MEGTTYLAVNFTFPLGEYFITQVYPIEYTMVYKNLYIIHL